MKKFLIVILLLLPVVCNAQIRVSKTSPSPVKVATIQLYWTEIWKHGDSYYLSMKSTNQFDSWFNITLGTNKEDILQSMLSLMDIISSLGDEESVTITDELGRETRITAGNELGIRYLYLDEYDKAGFGRIDRSGLNKAIKWFRDNLPDE